MGSPSKVRRPWGLAALLMAVTACSFVVETTKTQCRTDGDCAARGGDLAARVCGPAGTCIVATAAGCRTNGECSQAAGGAPAMCREGACVELLSEDCPRVVGDFANDNAIPIGTLLSIKGPNAATGEARQNSIEVAHEELTTNAVGLPGGAGGAPRPLVLVECDDSASASRAATHLVDRVRVPVILGAGASGTTLTVAQEVTIPKGVLLFAPSATSPALTTLQDNGLVWRSAPSDALQAVALVDAMESMEARYRAENAVAPATALKLSIVYKNDAYGSGLLAALTTSARINGKAVTDASNAASVATTSYDAAATDLSAQVAAIVAARPALLVLLGTTEAVTKVLAPLEAAWPQGGSAPPRPAYLLVDGGRKPELLAAIGANPGLRARVRGTVPGSPTPSLTFQAFQLRYQGKFGAPVPAIFGMSGAYDAFYMVMYGMVAAGNGPLTGASIAAALPRVVQEGGTVLEVGGSNIGRGLQTLQSGNGLRLRGASGPLDFDAATGEAPNDVDVWCITGGATGPAYASSGRYFSALERAMKGAVDATACQL